MSAAQLILIIISLVFVTETVEADELIRNTTLGPVRGEILTSRSGALYVSFKGIPYGQAKRFEPATLADPWDEPLDALYFGELCPQLLPTGGFIGDEDCLSMNIFVPQADRCKTEPSLLPTIFFIHGGSFVEGFGGVYGEGYLMDECVVFVSINYRLGTLGYLATSDGVLEGNLGLKDALLALRFFRDNAEAFQSDKDKLTIVGQSSGSTSVSHFIVSPAARGLFSAAITQSGSCLETWAVIPNPTAEAEKLGNFLNCSFESTSQLKSCLLAASVEDMLTYQVTSIDTVYVPRWLLDKVFVGPTIEPETSTNPNYEPFITKHPYQRLVVGDFSRVPLISGLTRDEGIMLQAGAMIQNPLAVQEYNTNWRGLAPKSLSYDNLNFTLEEQNEISDKIFQFYFGNSEVSYETYQNLIDLNSDRSVVQGTFQYNELHAKFAPVYPYVFTFVGVYSQCSLMLGLNYTVVSHGHDTPYIFRYGLAPDHEVGSDAEQLSMDLVRVWANFAKYGEPGPTWTEGIDWEQSDTGITFEIDIPAKNLVDYLQPRKLFWEQLGIFERQFQ